MDERRLEWRIARCAIFTAVIMVALAGAALAATLAPVKTTEPGPTPVAAVATVVEREPVATATPEPTATHEPAEPTGCHEQELEMLALVIYQEAGGDAASDECRQMVGEVVLNRMADPRYPDTLYEVLTQYGQYGRLHWTGLVWPKRADLPQEAHAVERAWHIAAVLLTGSVERLLPEDVIFQSEYVQGTEIVAEVDGFYFCR